MTRAHTSCWKRLVFVAIILLTVLSGIRVPAATARAQDPDAAHQETRGHLQAAKDNAVAGLVVTQGIVQHHAADAGEDAWETVVEDWRAVGVGDAVRTGAAGVATITFFEGAQVEVLPNSMVVIDALSVATDGTPDTVVLDVTLGDVLHVIRERMAPNVRYEVQTPGATLAVRGTEFWTSVDETERTRISLLAGELQVVGAEETTVVLLPEQTVLIEPTGQIGQVEPIGALPQYPPEGRRPPESCGDGVCSEEERSEEICPLDCRELPGCGDDECNIEGGEDLTTCPADCAPPPRGWRLHFFWGEMRCDFTAFAPHYPVQRGAAMFEWGVGCFDSAAHANAHPHPADYQLLVDGAAWDMSTLTQNGPHVHEPYCPWGWNFELGPVELPPGQHTLLLVETITDTWTTTTGGEDRGRTAGEMVQLECDVVVVP